jgi:hypothetical protein
MILRTLSKGPNVRVKSVAKMMNQRLNANIAGTSTKKTWLLSKSKWTREKLREWRKISKS